MLTKKENLLETLKKDGKPDRLVNQYTPFCLIDDPINRFTRGNRVKGQMSRDRWGTAFNWPADQHAGMPHITNDDKVLPDITRWREYVKVPDIKANCTDWKEARDMAAGVDRKEQLVMCFMGTGCFEQMNYLMGIEDTLANLLLEPEYMDELAEVIGEYRFTYTKLLVDNLHPDIIISHDDWGAKETLFMSPEILRRFFKPYYRKIYNYMKENGVIIMHHADSYCAPLIEDMVDLGIDIWQGVLPSNDIVKLQKQLDGRMTLMGGIDSIVDRADASEEEIRKEARRACETYGPGGYFIPSITYGRYGGSIYPHVDPVIRDEIDRYNMEVYGHC